MKKLSIFLLANLLIINFACLTARQAFSQNGVSINATGTAADISAMLDVSDTTKGILIPRITETQKMAIASPANGLLIYQTDNIIGFWYYDTSIPAWMQAIGPQGPTGATGTDGLNGATGTNGTDGATGATGVTGVTGSAAIIHTITGTTDASILVATWTDMPQMLITFTPSKPNAIILFTASGYDNMAGQEVAYARIVKDGVSLLGTNTITSDNDGTFGGIVTSWNLGINYPVSLTVGVATTIKVQWRTYQAVATLYNYIVSDPDKTCHRTLTIYEY